MKNLICFFLLVGNSHLAIAQNVMNRAFSSFMKVPESGSVLALLDGAGVCYNLSPEKYIIEVKAQKVKGELIPIHSSTDFLYRRVERRFLIFKKKEVGAFYLKNSRYLYVTAKGSNAGAREIENILNCTLLQLDSLKKDGVVLVDSVALCVNDMRKKFADNYYEKILNQKTVGGTIVGYIFGPNAEVWVNKGIGTKKIVVEEKSCLRNFREGAKIAKYCWKNRDKTYTYR